MTIVSVVTTVSHRYYAKRRKSDVRRRIMDLHRALGEVDAKESDYADMTADQLASAAMRLHARFPEE
jgi:hypothetical protein